MRMETLVTAVVTGVISIIMGEISISDEDDIHFFKPVLTPLQGIIEYINRRNNQTEKCPNCSSDFIKPYLQITLRRIELGGFLGSIISGLWIQALILLLTESPTCGLSLIIWSSLPGTLLIHYVWHLRDVFSFWNKSVYRFILAPTMIVTGLAVSEAPFLLDIVGWALNPEYVLLAIGQYIFTTGMVICIFVIALVIFIILRTYWNKHMPSLRNVILRLLERNPGWYTIRGWQDIIDPEQVIWSEDDILKTIRELVYQGKMSVRLESRTSQPIYGQS